MIDLRVAHYRKQHNLTQIELTKRLGVSFQTVSKWETGSSYPDIEMITIIADIFGISVDELLSRSGKVKEFPRKDNSTYWSKELEYLQETRKELWNDDYFEFLAQKVWKLTEEPIDVVDFGCGFGYIGIKLMPLLPEGSTYTGIDISKKLISQAKRLFHDTEFKTEFMVCDLYEYIPSKTFDISICQALMRHLNNPEVVLKKMIDSTIQNGKMNIEKVVEITQSA